MQPRNILRGLTLSASLTAVLALGALPASAQTATSTTCGTAAAAPTTSNAQAGDLTSAAAAPRGTSTPAMVQEACQRQRARTAKFVNCGVPEQFGSEEPFTFQPSKPCS